MTSRVLTGSTAFNLLLSLEEAVLLNGGAVPKSTDSSAQWSGVRCVVAGMNFIVPLHQVAEILEPRSVTSIPGCAAWVKGLMNVRGRLLPVFGVSEFFKGARTSFVSSQILLVEQGSTFCGIAVDKVFGIQKFFQNDFSEGNLVPEAGLEGLGEHVGFFTVMGSDNWYQLDIGGLATRMSHTNPAATHVIDSRVDGPRPPPVSALADTMPAATNAR
jgi:twitching motility protein PilI